MRWVLTGYLVSAAIITPVIGRLGDMYGKRRWMLIGLVVFTRTSVAAALAPNIWFLIAARVVQGVGGGLSPLCFGIIGDALDRRERAAALGIIAFSTVVLFGVGMSLSSLPNPIMDNTPADERGQATGMNVLFRSLGTAIGSQVVGTMIAGSIHGDSPLPQDSAFTDEKDVAAAVG